MDWKKIKSKFSGTMTKEKWLLLLAAGILLMILSFPPAAGTDKEKKGENQHWSLGQEEGKENRNEGKEGEEYLQNESPGGVPLWEKVSGMENSGIMENSSRVANSSTAEHSGEGDSVWQTGASPQKDHSYEKGLEERIEYILRSVEGVGKVDVMVVLKSSSEKILHTDRQENISSTKETDSSGGSRQIESSQTGENIVLSGGSGQEPIVEKELSPEISGIVISAQGGGDPIVKNEISQAMEALFGLPVHKIKVLKRVE